MNLLAIDTSTELASVALMVNDEIISDQQDSIRQHAQCLLPMLHRLLATAALSFTQLDGIVFGAGPGSFTGLRITCSIAKALGYAHDLPLLPVNSLAAIAMAVQETERDLTPEVQILAVIDARMQQLYWANFQLMNPQAFSLPQIRVDAAADIELSFAGPCILAGVGFMPYQAALPVATQAKIIAERTIFPHARELIKIAKLGGIQSCSAAEALPLYVRNQVTQGATRG